MDFRFEGIDDWNRPVFKQVDGDIRLGDLDHLFEWKATADEVCAEINETHVCYFGMSFNCEPMGSLVNPTKIKIVK